MLSKTQIIATPSYVKGYRRLTNQMRKIVDAKIEQLISNPAHPSLQVHRLRRAKADVWSAYISFNKRLIYQRVEGKIYLHEVGEHAIIERVHLRGF